MNIITAWNLKGGTGKTTTAFNLAALTAKKGYRTLVLDLDMQANLTSFFDADTAKIKTARPDIAEILTSKLPVKKGIYKSRFSNLDYIKGSDEIANVQPDDINVLGSKLAPLAENYDICITDCHPDTSFVTENALAIADLVLIPIMLDGFSRDNLNLVTKEIIKLENECGEINFKVYVNRLRNLKSQRIIYKDLVQNHDYPLLETSITEYSGVQSALLSHKPLYMHRSRSAASSDYADLAEEVLREAGVM